VIGGAVAIGVIRVLYPDITPEEASEILIPHESMMGTEGPRGRLRTLDG
jgi:hypothetical protein